MGTAVAVNALVAEGAQRLPPRLAALAGALGTVEHPGQAVRHNLPAGWKVTEADRKGATGLLSTLTSMLDPQAPFEVENRVVDGHMAKGALLTKMIDGLAGPANPTATAQAAKIEMYADAIEDLPAWAIDKAIKRWARGECPYSVEEHPRYAFPPAPATLRAMALFDLEDLRRNEQKLKNVLAAIPLERAMNPEPLPKSFGVGPALRRM